MRHVIKLCGEEKNQNSDLLNCSIPGNKRLQGGMDLKKKKKMESVRKKTDWRVNRWFTKTSYPVPGPYTQYALLPKICRVKPLSTWCKTRMKRPINGEDRISWEESVKSFATRKGKENSADFIPTLSFSCHKVTATETFICKFGSHSLQGNFGYKRSMRSKTKYIYQGFLKTIFSEKLKQQKIIKPLKFNYESNRNRVRQNC